MKKFLFLSTLFLLFSACQTKSTPSDNRWLEYEDALTDVLLPYPDEPGLCEWEVWGQTDQEVYVWALCEEKKSERSAGASAPVVISLAENGDIEKVIIPRDGIFYAPDIKQLFPPDVQTRIFEHQFDATTATTHIDKRRQDNTIPPMIVEVGITLP